MKDDESASSSQPGQPRGGGSRAAEYRRNLSDRRVGDRICGGTKSRDEPNGGGDIRDKTTAAPAFRSQRGRSRNILGAKRIYSGAWLSLGVIGSVPLRASCEDDSLADVVTHHGLS